VSLLQHGKKVLKADMIDKLDVVKAKLLREIEDLGKPGATLPRLPSPASESPLAEADSSPEALAPADNTDAVTETAAVEAEIPAVNGMDEARRLMFCTHVSDTRVLGKGEPAQKKRKMELPEDLVRLSFDDISADLASIAIDRKDHSETANAALPSTQLGTMACGSRVGLNSIANRVGCGCWMLAEPMKIERRRLFCGKNIFQDGDEVVIASPVIKEDYVGRISSMTDEAVRLTSTTIVSADCPRLKQVAVWHSADLREALVGPKGAHLPGPHQEQALRAQAAPARPPGPGRVRVLLGAWVGAGESSSEKRGCSMGRSSSSRTFLRGDGLLVLLPARGEYHI